MAGRCLAPQLVPSWTSSERNFEQCWPSLKASATAGPCTHRKSQVVHYPLSHHLDEISLLGMIIQKGAVGAISGVIPHEKERASRKEH
ncbi:MAG TPA: hypothetical protein VKD65_13545, partial [Candidatus Angelobacter sp.]|nr:hypothetical protein [Candidatus Angelobacter sp.]